MLISEIKGDACVSSDSPGALAPLDRASKLKLLLKSGAIEEIGKVIERQTSGLTLLLSAHTW